MNKEEYKKYIVKIDHLLAEIDEISEEILKLMFEILRKIEN